MSVNNKLNFFGVEVNNLSLPELNAYISKRIYSGKKTMVGYVTANSLNKVYINEEDKKLFEKFNVVHPDGVGLFLASKFLYGKNGFQQRVTGSDYYPFLIKEAVENEWSIFFFGDDDSTLDLVKTKAHGFRIAGMQNGYNFDNDELIKRINESCADILIVGLGCPKQEKWILKNRDKVNTKLLMAVGDGIKVFAGTKIRGYLFFRRIGLEWFIRLINHPVKYWKRYFLGIPLFIYRILKYKLIKR